MRINTITCHDVYNAGASLQAYALQTYLAELGHDVKIIDYKPDYLCGHYRLWGGVSPKFDKPFLRTAYSVAKLPSRIIRRLGKRKKEYDKFTHQYLNLTCKYRTNDELLASPPKADVYFAGSDQIWNTLFQNGKDPAFYLDFAPIGAIRASYAASFAVDRIADGWEKQVKKWLLNIDYISVREEQGLNILKGLGIENGQRVLDPVFLLNEVQWGDLADKWENPLKRPYIFVYAFNDDGSMAEFAQRMAKEKNLEVVSYLKNENISTDFSNDGPIAFLSLIKNASVVVANSFHATAFSLIFEKDVYVFGRKEKVNSRMKDMMSLVGLSNRYMPETYAEEIDYTQVKEKISAMTEVSKEYIASVLSQAEQTSI